MPSARLDAHNKRRKHFKHLPKLSQVAFVGGAMNDDDDDAAGGRRGRILGHRWPLTWPLSIPAQVNSISRCYPTI